MTENVMQSGAGNDRERDFDENTVNEDGSRAVARGDDFRPYRPPPPPKRRMSPRSAQFAVTSLVCAAAVFFSLGSTLLVLQHWHFPAAYISLNKPPPGETNDAHYARQIGRNAIVIGREFQITRDVRLRINREIVMKSVDVASADPTGGKYQMIFRKELETTNVTYHPGYYKTERELTLPQVPPGKYTIVNVVCWEVNFLREECVDLPDVSVVISDQIK